MHSENAEMYLVTMALLEEKGISQPIPLPLLAEELDVQAVSVNQMIRKLEEEGLVQYQPYKGVSFSETGAIQVQAFLRHRRLWETFFVEHLGFTPQDADALACRMEHITEPQMADRLSEFLGNPLSSPTGKSIPQKDSLPVRPNQIQLSVLQAGEQAQVVAISADPTTLSYLQGHQLTTGAELKILAVSGENAWLVQAGETTISLTREIADSILVSRIDQK